MITRQKKRPALASKPGVKLTTSVAYHALDLVQAPFGFVFWKIEQLKAGLQDKIENERSCR
jgi:hypothetical protein